MPAIKRFDDFIVERNIIVKDIDEFLNVVLLYCVDKEEKRGYDSHDIFTTEHARSLMVSLNIIHSYYGYPKKNSEDKPRNDFISFDKDAIKNVVLNDVKTNDDKEKTLGHYCQDITTDNFWQDVFRTDETFTLEDLPLREPAYIFLQMVQVCERNDPSKIARMHLSKLHDGNYLKPVVWVEAEDNPKKYFAVSVGIRPYLRHLYLYTKLSSLNYSDNNLLALKKVKAFQSMKRDKHEESYNPDKKSGYKSNESEDEGDKVEKEPKRPCPSCKIFFSQNGMLEGEKIENFNYFGNCAEYDIVQEENSEERLNDIRSNNDNWETFKLECQKHFEAFTTLKGKIETSQQQNEPLKRRDMHDYYNKTRKIYKKALKYKWSDSREIYELVTQDQ